jgi:hypothetical protein
VEKRASSLEEALLAAWDRDTLAVYADHLQAEGDPRGELIALDLQIEATGNNVELSKRRTSLVFAWLGSLVPVDNVHASWVGDSLRFGFVEDLQIDGNDPSAVARLEQVLESPAGPYVRGVTLAGNAAALEGALRTLAEHEHAWLTQMSIGTWNQTVIATDVAQQAFAKMPRLKSLELRPWAAFSPLSHPTIEKLAIRGEAVYRALGDGAKFDAVTELELDLTGTAVGWDEYYDEEYAVEAPEPPQPAEFPEVAFPALRKLDLSPNVTNIDAAYAFLKKLAARTHVTHLKIPQLRAASDRENLMRVTRDMPKLEVVEVAMGHYYEPADIPGVRFVRAETWPWPTEELAQDVGMRIYQGSDTKFGDTVSIVDAVRVMERRFEKLPQPAREAWSQLWRLFATIKERGKKDPVNPARFSARAMADAVEAIPELMANGWRELREELSARRPFAADATVGIERCKPPRLDWG